MPFQAEAFKIMGNEFDAKGIGVTGLPDSPGFSTYEMQRKLDERATYLAYEKINPLLDAMELQLATEQDVNQKISEAVFNSGSADMTKAVYDTNSSGVVDDSERLGGHTPSYYAKATDVPKTNNEPLNFYVNGTTGSDSNDGTADRPFATVAYALSTLPNILSHDATVICTGYVGPLAVDNFGGVGILAIRPDGSSTYFDVGANPVNFTNNSTRVIVTGSSTSYAAGDVGSYGIRDCSALTTLNACRLTGAGVSASRGISAYYGDVYVTNLAFGGSRTNGYFAGRCSTITVFGNSGTSPTTLVRASGGTIKVEASSLSVTTGISSGGLIVGTSGASVG